MLIVLFVTNSPDSNKRRFSKVFNFNSNKKTSFLTENKIDSTELIKIRNEVESYLKIEYNDEIDAECFWRGNKSQFPYLYALAAKYLAVPASSSPVERMFSVCGYINRPHRARITPEHLEQLVLLKTNFKLID